MLSTFNLIPTAATSIKVGEMYGQLTVLETGQIAGSYRYFAVCQCSCGSDPKAIRFDGLKAGKVISCGCVHKANSTRHGLVKSPHYNRWKNMLDRCENPECSAFENYGGRGIKVCARWHDLAVFVADVSGGYFAGAEIDRIDNDGDYEPGNVRWVTRGDNCRNRRTTTQIAYMGRSQSIAAWAAELGISAKTLRTRLNQDGWSVERALQTPAIGPAERMALARRARSAGKAN